MLKQCKSQCDGTYALGYGSAVNRFSKRESARLQAYMLGGAYLGGSTVDMYQLKGNIDQVCLPHSTVLSGTNLPGRY